MSYKNKTPKDFEVGQVVWYKSNDRHRRGNSPTLPYNVTKVGRKWVTIRQGDKDYTEERFDPSETRFRGMGWPCDGGDFSSPGTVYLREEDLKLEEEQQRLYDEIICQHFSSFVAFIPLEKLQAVKAILEETSDA